MKKLVFSTFALFLALTTFAADVPAVVKTAFQQKFAAAKNVKWDKENAHEYEANFVLDGVACSANFSDAGEWLETETHTEFTALPSAVQTAFKTQKANVKVVGVAKITTAKGATKYEIEYKNGLRTKELYFDESGALLK